MIPLDHPYWHVRDVLMEARAVSRVTLSMYKYKAREISDKRIVRALSFREFCDTETVLRIMRGVPSGQELAFHGTVAMSDGRIEYLPMVDMATAKQGKLDRVAQVGHLLNSTLMQKFLWFDSGRSFHGYGSSLISELHWHKLMGLLLLVNAPGMEPVVDPRWIGHRLLGGYSTLRWTCNSEHYLQVPKRIDPEILA